MRKRILALAMAATLFVGILPAASFADETDTVPEVTVIAEEITETVGDSTESTQDTTAATEEPAETIERITCATEATEPMEETLSVVEEVPDLTLSDLESTEHEINSAADLVELYNEVAAGDSKAGHSYTFTTDITLPEGWKPIGTLRPGTNGSDSVNEEHILPFSGVIDGAGHTLIVPEGGLPLLGYVKGATVRNLNIYGTKIAGAGLVNNYTLRFKVPPVECSAIIIDNVTLKSGSKTLKSGLVAASDPNQYACASAGFTVTIRNSVIEAGVTIGYDKQESQIGSFAARISGTIENCESSAVVYGKDYVGGILGTKDNAMGKCQVRNCKFHGTVEASGSYAGGIVGGGYDNSTAPNGGCPTILLCSVDGAVKGDARVGGIFGGDGFVAQTWDNVVGSISFNNFTGKVSGKKYVGAIIGYRNSLNKYDTIRDNTFSAGCGADKGIGFVQYLDTSYKNPAKMEGTIVFNTGAGVSKCPDVEGCEWKADHNRTDDPLGVDAEKLCKKTGAEDSPSCYELKVSGEFKTEYTVGQELDLTGIELTAYWTDGSTTEVELKDVKITGYQKNTVGEQKVTLSYESAIAYITVTVKPDSTKIKVSVSILGDSHHSDPISNGGPHGLAMGGLTTWVSASGVQADAKETVWDVLQRVGESNGISYSADSNNSYGTVYIRGVNGLSEFDNGSNSGWMYTVNGSHPNVGVSARYVKNGDKIVLHYTDDYTYEEGGVNYGKSGTAAGTTNTANTTTENSTAQKSEEQKQSVLKAMGSASECYTSTGDYMETLGTPSVGSIGGEWMVIGLARADREVPGVEDYYQSVVDYVREHIDENQRLHKAKSTDNSRLILALTAIGKDVTNVDGHDLLLGLNDLDFVKKQGNNGPIWALLALDSGNYPEPEGNLTRQSLIDEILSVQTSDGGWAISGDEADSDMTGMALQSLAPYYSKDPAVQEAVDKALARLSQMQNDDGGFSTFSGNGGKVATSESASQVIVALTALDIDPNTDERFIKNGCSVIDALQAYSVAGGGFRHVMDGQLDGMATEQAYYALTAYYRLLAGKTSLYDMTDIIDMGGVAKSLPTETNPNSVVSVENGETSQHDEVWILLLGLSAGILFGIVLGIGLSAVVVVMYVKMKRRFDK